MFKCEIGDQGLSSFKTSPTTNRLIFLLFTLLLSNVLWNLWKGQAINDIRVVKMNAEMVCTEAREILISRIEGLVNVLPVCMKCCVELREEMFVIYPNRRNRIGSAAALSLINIVIKKKEPNRKDKSVGTEEDWSFCKEILSDLQILQEKMQKKIDSIF